MVRALAGDSTMTRGLPIGGQLRSHPGGCQTSPCSGTGVVRPGRDPDQGSRFDSMELRTQSRAASSCREQLLEFMDTSRVPGRGGLRRADGRPGRPPRAPSDRRGPQGRGPLAGALEPVHAPRTEWTPGPGQQPRLRATWPRSSGRSMHLAPEAMNCAAPDTGNMEVLTLFGTPEQKEQWLAAAARGRDPLGVRDDRARRGLVGRHQHPAVDRPRRRRVRAQRPQVVDLGRRVAPLQGLHRDGQDRPRRRRATSSSR